MALEIERKFLVDQEKWELTEKQGKTLLRQGFLVSEIHKIIRVRIAGEKAFLTIKGKTTGATRLEFEYEIPVKDAEELLNQFGENEMSKYRYEINFAGKLWEVDEFLGENKGLIVAEIELDNADEKIELPDFVTQEVTEDARYYNVNLAKKPYTKW